MIIYYSGDGGVGTDPEYTLGSEANLMLTYFKEHGKAKLTPRFRRVRKARKRGRPITVRSKHDQSVT